MCKRRSKEMIQENQTGIFMMNMCKAYERVKKIQNESKQEKISCMQTVGRKSRSTVDNLVTMSAVTEKQRQDHKISTHYMQM